MYLINTIPYFALACTRDTMFGDESDGEDGKGEGGGGGDGSIPVLNLVEDKSDEEEEEEDSGSEELQLLVETLQFNVLDALR